MATNEIKITPEQMRTRASEYNAQADAVGEVISKMDSLLSQLRVEWTGQASTAYAEKFNDELRPSFVKAAELIDEIAAALTATAKSLEDTDSGIAQQFRA